MTPAKILKASVRRDRHRVAMLSAQVDVWPIGHPKHEGAKKALVIRRLNIELCQQQLEKQGEARA